MIYLYSYCSEYNIIRYEYSNMELQSDGLSGTELERRKFKRINLIVFNYIIRSLELYDTSECLQCLLCQVMCVSVAEGR